MGTIDPEGLTILIGIEIEEANKEKGNKNEPMSEAEEAPGKRLSSSSKAKMPSGLAKNMSSIGRLSTYST